MAGITPLPPMPALSSIGGADLSGIAGAGGASSIAGSASATGGQSFVNTLGDALSRLNTQLASADASMTGFAAGTSADIGSVMLQLQEASLGLKLGVQVRDRLLDAYRDVMHLSV